MARINSTELVLKISKLQRDNEEDETLLSDENIAQLIEVIEQLSVPNVLVELDITD